jgi:hypothetical protein
MNVGKVHDGSIGEGISKQRKTKYYGNSLNIGTDAFKKLLNSYFASLTQPAVAVGPCTQLCFCDTASGNCCELELVFVIIGCNGGGLGIGGVVFDALLA